MANKIYYSTIFTFYSFRFKQAIALHSFITKSLYVLVFSFLFLSLCTTGNAQQMKTKQKDDKIKVKGTDMKQKFDYPYTAEYSSNFVPGNPAHAKLILEMWKAWDDNALDRHANMIADTVVAFFPTGDVVSGKDSFMASAKQFRGMFSSVKSNVAAWMPLLSVDRNENWVAIWGREEDTDKDGKT